MKGIRSGKIAGESATSLGTGLELRQRRLVKTFLGGQDRQQVDAECKTHKQAGGELGSAKQDDVAAGEGKQRCDHRDGSGGQ